MARSFVQQRQRNLVRIAYLLTGDENRAVRLAVNALLDLLTDPPDELDNAGRHLAFDITRRYLRNPSRSTWLDREDEAGFYVDDERSRVREALDRLEPTQRAALVLSNVAGFSDSRVREALGIDRHDAYQDLHEQAWARVAVAAGRASDAPLVDLFNRVLIDAPTTDLWPELEAPAQRAWSKRQRTDRLLTIGVVVGVLLVLAGSVIWLTGFRPGDDGTDTAGVAGTAGATATPEGAAEATPTTARASFAAAATLTPPAETSVSIQDLHLMRVVEDISNGRDALEIYDPTTNTSTPFLTAGGVSRISPDGRWIVAERRLSNSPATSLLAGGSVDGSVSWELTLSSPSAYVVGNDHAFLVNRESIEAYQIQVVELAAGEVVDVWPVDAASADPFAVRSTRLFLSPDGERLTLLTTRVDLDADRWTRTLTVYQSGTGEVLDVINQDDHRDNDDTRFSVRSARQVAGENALYSLIEDEWSSVVRLQFLDLDSGEVAGVLLPLQARSAAEAERRGEDELHAVPSNTGEILYVIQSRQRRVAVVDMRSRSLVGAFPMTATDANRSLFESNLNHVSYLEARLSPGGEWLYMAVNRERNAALRNYPSESPVWVVNTTTWEVAGRLTVSGMPRSMSMSGDGDRLYIRSVDSSRTSRLTAFDIASGEVIDVWESLPSPDWAAIQMNFSLVDLYHSQHGFRPRAGSLIPRDNPVLSVLPGVVIEAEGAVAGAESVLIARIVHPVSGEPAMADGSLRFDPDARLAIELSNGDQRAILVPTSTEPGIYRGRVRLDHAGIWDARVTVVNQDGATWAVNLAAAVRVAEGLAASDGGAYRFDIRPGNPVNRRTITLRVRLVEAQGGERLQQDIQFLDSIVGAPTLLLTHSSGEHHEILLDPLDHATYLGWVRLAEPGEWTARVVLELATGERFTVNAGTLEIGDLMAPYSRPNPNPGPGSDTNGASGATNTSGGTRMASPSSQ